MKGKSAPKDDVKAIMMAAKKPGKGIIPDKAAPGDIKTPEGAKVEGVMNKRRLDRPGRKLGGKVGADVAPLSSAAKSKRC